jgi:hypothetical protein
MALALSALLAALWGGLARMGWDIPAPPALPGAHGPLMVAGFLGTVIGLERAVALGGRWPYAAPLLAGLGALLLIVGLPGWPGPLMEALGSLGLAVVFGAIVRRQPALYSATMALGALLWLAGNLLWLLGWPIFRVVPWWAGFLVLTIAGERLELGRLLRLPRGVQAAFALIVALLALGLAASAVAYDTGVRLAGAAMAALALWLLRCDIARRTVRKPGLTRFIALCMLSGYVWLGASGALWLAYGGVPAGLPYDAILHALFVGFVFAMIFGHAPIIIPAVLGLPAPFRRGFYAHLALLHLSLLLRVAGDLAGAAALRQWGGLLNAAALLLFFASTAWAIRRSRKEAQACTPRPATLSARR